MPVFLISGTNENGKRETRRVEADHSQDAVREFEEQGLTDIVLHSDDAYAVTTDLFGPQPYIAGIRFPGRMSLITSCSGFFCCRFPSVSGMPIIRSVANMTD